MSRPAASVDIFQAIADPTRRALLDRLRVGHHDTASATSTIDSHLPSTILRLPMVYGPRDPLRRLFSYLKRMDENRPVILLEESLACWRGCWSYVENVAEAIALAVTDERAAGRIFNVAEQPSVTEAERIRNIGRIAGWNGEVVVVPTDQMPESWNLVL